MATAHHYEYSQLRPYRQKKWHNCDKWCSGFIADRPIVISKGRYCCTSLKFPAALAVQWLFHSTTDMVRISPLRGLFSMHSHQCFIEVMMNLSTSSPRTSLPYIGFQLIFLKTNKDPNKHEGLTSVDATNHWRSWSWCLIGQHYQIQPNTELPEIDCFTHMDGMRYKQSESDARFQGGPDIRDRLMKRC